MRNQLREKSEHQLVTMNDIHLAMLELFKYTGLAKVSYIVFNHDYS